MVLIGAFILIYTGVEAGELWLEAAITGMLFNFWGANALMSLIGHNT